jgi:hypothetical protein
LDFFSPIWPGRVELHGQNLGDVWPHPDLPAGSNGENLVPLHKLSQWLAYSLVEPLAHAGIEVVNIDDLTGLAEYRNGGLFIDSNALVLKDRALFEVTHEVGAPLIVEWRAATVILLDRVAEAIRKEVPVPLSVGQVLQGGTWSAGRAIAAYLREGGGPPLKIQSDGTVF